MDFLRVVSRVGEIFCKGLWKDVVKGWRKILSRVAPRVAERFVKGWVKGWKDFVKDWRKIL